MVTPANKRSSNTLCEFHNDKGHSTDECMQLKNQIEELVKAGKLSHFIKEIRQDRDKQKNGKKEAPAKEKVAAIYMIQSWHMVTRQKVTLSFSHVNEITFPPLSANKGTEGPLVIEAEIRGHAIHRMYVDGGSSMEVLYQHCFNRLRPEIKSQMVPATTFLTGFSVETIWPLGQLRLLVTIRDAEHFTEALMNFMIVRSPSPYNGIIGRPRIREIQVVPSTAYGMLKFPVNGGVVTIRSTILTLNECVTIMPTSKDSIKKIEGGQENLKVAIHPDFPDQEVALGGTLSIEGRTTLCALLKRNLDIFAWQPSDMTGVPRQIAEHRLNIRDGYPPVRQKKRGQAPERAKAIQHDDSWRMCVDFTNLNKACPQDCYPLPEIDWKVESLCGYPFKCFLDAYKGYHQIQMAELDEEKTAFHTPHGVYCYTKMSFGLKNAGATYQRLVDKASEKQVGWNLEVYVDDLVIKSHTEAELLWDIKETFRTLKEELIMYLSASQGAVGAVLMTERDSIQTPVYFVSRALQGPELNYTPMEKLVLALVFAAKRLRRYFQAHPIAVITDQPIKQVMSRPDVAGRLQKWSIMLGEHNITYRPRTSIKASWRNQRKPQRTCAGLILTSPDGAEFTYALRFQFTASNNEAGYEALLAGLCIAAQMGVHNVQVSVDSKLVANQVLGTYIAKEENMIKYLEKVKTLVSGFASFSISQVPRSHNKKADALSKIASTSFAHLSKQVLVEVLQEKSIQEKEVATVVEEEGPTWMTPITEYLKDGVLPNDKKEANKLRIKARQYELMDGILYRRSFLRPWLRCVGPLQADYVIREIHEGSCSMHAGPLSVVAKAMWSGYYWPTMHRDARDMILKCKDCQVHRPVPRNPQQPLTPITSPWLFYKWGIDIKGPFPEGPGKVKFLIVVIHYFTKWIEAKVVASINGGQVKKFVWDNIVCRFGLPREIVLDSGKQFSDNPFKDWCEKLNITQRFASVKHPQSNGLVERANISLGEGIKARLGEGNKKWIEEIPHVLWAYHTMIKSSNGDTPFSLTYGTEVVIPAKIGMTTYRTAVVDAVHNDDEIRLNLDLLEERRERAAIREAKAKSKMTRYYNARVHGVTFKPGDYVYHSNKASHAMDGGKLGQKWEGPYEVTEVLGDGAYKLRSMDGAVLPRTWNIANLKKCYL
ncbi:reverse transcriptase domain-containing protein [Tanacetum coccineum]|uniref:RNA-directed DNA polymerase n=1 Tax=Tanacetum coccineum TaxID=301880 RepID=A0ABQ4WBF0_9ASTR